MRAQTHPRGRKEDKEGREKGREGQSRGRGKGKVKGGVKRGGGKKGEEKRGKERREREKKGKGKILVTLYTEYLLSELLLYSHNYFHKVAITYINIQKNFNYNLGSL